MKRNSDKSSKSVTTKSESSNTSGSLKTYGQSPKSKNVVPVPTKSKMDLNQLMDDLNEFTQHYDSLTQANAEDIIDHVKEKLQKLFIKVTYDHPSIVFKRKQLKITPSLRIVLATQRGKADYSIPLCRQCNGIIIQFYELRNVEESRVKCRILNISSPDFNPERATNLINAHIENNLFEVYEANDGTTLNMYYDPLACTSYDLSESNENCKEIGRWVFSTKRGLDVEKIVWRGTPYEDVLNDLFKIHNFDVSKLDKNKCYSVGFKHPAYHPFEQPWDWNSGIADANESSWIKRMWFIQSVNLTTNEISFEDDIGLPFQKKIDILKFGTQKYMQRLTKNSNEALEKYILALKEQKPRTALFGYILRSKDPSKTREHSDIFIESTLMKAIRNNIYNMPYIKNKEEREKKAKLFQDLKYIILESYLDFRRRIQFLQLFPQFKYQYEQFSTLVDGTVNNIYTAIIKESKENKDVTNSERLLTEFFIPIVKEKISIDNDKTSKSAVQNKPKPIKFGEFFPSEFKQQTGKNEKNKKLGDESIKKTIRDIIVNPKYIHKYISVIYEPFELENSNNQDM